MASEHTGQWTSCLSAENHTPSTSNRVNEPGGLTHAVNLHVRPSALVSLGHSRHDFTRVSLKLTLVDILPKPSASTRPWRVYYLQTGHGPPGVQLHLQASCEIGGPGKRPGSPPEEQTRAVSPGFCCLWRESEVGYRLTFGARS